MARGQSGTPGLKVVIIIERKGGTRQAPLRSSSAREAPNLRRWRLQREIRKGRSPANSQILCIEPGHILQRFFNKVEVQTPLRLPNLGEFEQIERKSFLFGERALRLDPGQSPRGLHRPQGQDSPAFRSNSPLAPPWRRRIQSTTALLKVSATHPSALARLLPGAVSAAPLRSAWLLGPGIIRNNSAK